MNVQSTPSCQLFGHSWPDGVLRCIHCDEPKESQDDPLMEFSGPPDDPETPETAALRRDGQRMYYVGRLAAIMMEPGVIADWATQIYDDVIAPLIERKSDG